MCEQSCSLIVPIRIVIIFAHKQHKTPLVHYYRKQQYARFNAARLNLELKKHSRLFSANINLAVTQKTFVRSLDNKTEIQQSRRRALLIGGWGGDTPRGLAALPRQQSACPPNTAAQPPAAQTITRKTSQLLRRRSNVGKWMDCFSSMSSTLRLLIISDNRVTHGYHTHNYTYVYPTIQ